MLKLEGIVNSVKSGLVRNILLTGSALLMYASYACGGTTPAPTITSQTNTKPSATETIMHPTSTPPQTEQPEPTPENTYTTPQLVPDSIATEVAPTLFPPTTTPPEPTVAPSPTPPPTATSVPPTPVPPNFIFEDNHVRYEGGKVLLDTSNSGGLGTLVARLYDPSNTNNSFPVQEHAFAPNENHRFGFDISQLQRGIDYNLKLDFINKTSGETKTFDVPGFYIPRAAVLQFDTSKVDYNRDEKRLTIPIKNSSPDSRDNIAKNVKVELYDKNRLLGTANSVAIKPNSIENLVVSGVSLTGGTNNLTAKITYNDGFSIKEQTTDPIAVEVPYLPANLTFTDIPGSNSKIAVSLGQDGINPETELLRSDLPHTFKVNLTNIGETTYGKNVLDRTFIEFYRDSIGPSNKLASAFLPRIEPGNPNEVEARFKVNATGKHKIYAVVPEYGMTLETTVTVEAAPATVTAPHHSLVDLSLFDKKYYDAPYTKYLDAGGIPIVGAGHVSDEAFYAARDILDGMLHTRPDIRKVLANFKPEFRPSWAKSDSVYVVMQPKSGLSSTALGLVATNEANLLCSRDDGHKGLYSTLVHELAHIVMDAGLPFVDGGEGIIKAIEESYNDAMRQGKWKNTYAAKNRFEYWAEGVSSWFDATKYPAVPGFSNGVNTREELKAYDPQLESIILSVFGNNEWMHKCPVSAQ